MFVVISIVLHLALACFAEYRRTRSGITWFFGTATATILLSVVMPYAVLIVPLSVWLIVAILPEKETPVEKFIETKATRPRQEPLF